jgi:periplasmic protein TonB
MRVFQLGVLLFIFLATSYGQSVTKCYCCIDVAIIKEKKKIYATIENKLGYTCADSSWLQSVEKQINESLQLLKKIKKGKYLVAVQYILDKESIVSDVRPLTSHGYGLEEAVIRVLKKRSKWIPAIQAGRTVRSYRTSAVTPEKE